MFPQNLKTDVISRFRSIHGDLYDYSRVRYLNSRRKVDVICAQHGNFRISPEHHLQGSGCQKCQIESRRMAREDFIAAARVKNGNGFSYDLVPNPFPGMGVKLSLYCNRHNTTFLQLPRAHLNGHAGCPECKFETRNRVGTRAAALEKWIARATEAHGNRYDYSHSAYAGMNARIEILCHEHGPFQQLAVVHLRGSGCPRCTAGARSRISTVAA